MASKIIRSQMLCLIINIPLFMVVVAILMKVTVKYSIDWTDAMVGFWTSVILLTSVTFILVWQSSGSLKPK